MALLSPNAMHRHIVPYVGEDITNYTTSAKKSQLHCFIAQSSRQPLGLPRSPPQNVALAVWIRGPSVGTECHLTKKVKEIL